MCCFLVGQLNLQCTLVTRTLLHQLAQVSVQSDAPVMCIVRHMNYRWIEHDRTTLKPTVVSVWELYLHQLSDSKLEDHVMVKLGTQKNDDLFGLLDSVPIRIPV